MEEQQKLFDFNLVKIKKSHVFKVPELRKILGPGDKVHFCPECLFTEKVMDEEIKFIQILVREKIPFYVPVYILEFNSEQRGILARKGVLPEDLECPHFAREFVGDEVN